MAKEVKIRAISACFVDVFQKTFGDVIVEVERRHYDAWADISLKLRPGVDLPQSGETIIIEKIASEFDILDVSSQCYIEHEIETDIEDDDILEQVESCLEDDDFGDWETKGAYGVIDEYTFI